MHVYLGAAAAPNHLNIMKPILLNHIFAVLLSVILTACGGGGGSETSSSSPGTQSGGGGSQSVPVSDPVQNAPVQLLPNSVEPVSEIAAIRFLEQASFGPTPETVARVQQLGFSAYLDEQMSLPASTFATPAEGDNTTLVRERFYSNAMNGQDQLRQRVAYALGQLFVVSAKDVTNVDAITSYQRMLMENAFTTYAALLEEVTLHPAMGKYLDMVNNAAGENPNENYAREVMQLFSIGMVKLLADGSPILDSQGIPVPTYSQAEVEGLARALTGWTFPVTPGGVSSNSNPGYYYGRMVAVNALHDQGEKRILGGVILPAGQTAATDLSAALDTIASHPNVAPFISFRLIQHLVTSNPNAAYIQRVSAVFDNNGQGIRGDLKAVVKAILLDDEARRGDDPQTASDMDGRLKDPVLFATGLMRTLGPVISSSGLRHYVIAMGLDIYAAPSVFNYYAPDYRILGADILGPEFEIFTSPYIVARDNFVNALVLNWAADISVDLSAWTLLADNSTLLLDALDTQLFHGTMQDETRSIILNTLAALTNVSNQARAQIALYLAATSAEYSVHH